MNVLINSKRIVHAHRDKSRAHLCGGVGNDNMRKFTCTVLAALAVLMLAVGGVAAHGSNGAASNRDPVPENALAGEWGTWMEQHMTEHTSADSAAQMQDRMGMSYEEMGEYMASHQNGSMMNGGMMGGMMNGGMMDGMMNGMMRGGMSGMGCH